MQASELDIFNARLINQQPFELIDQSINKEVTVLTASGFEYTGILKGIDSSVNVILENATEVNPLYSNPQPKSHKQILINGAIIEIILPSQPKA